MKKLVASLIIIISFSFSSNAQVKTVSLEQTSGEFTQKSITLSEGEYIFEISNVGVDHEVVESKSPENIKILEGNVSHRSVNSPNDSYDMLKWKWGENERKKKKKNQTKKKKKKKLKKIKEKKTV